MYESERTREEIFIKIKGDTPHFWKYFYKSLIRACFFVSLAASQNARSCGQTINHRALRICKKRIQKVLMLSPFILINISSHVLSDSYNETLFKSPHSVYVIRYWLIIFVFVNRRWKGLNKHRFSEMFWNIINIYLPLQKLKTNNV